MKPNMGTVQLSVCVPRKRVLCARLFHAARDATPAAVRVPPLGGTSSMKRNMSTVLWSGTPLPYAHLFNRLISASDNPRLARI
jgi:hypothetical protein